MTPRILIPILNNSFKVPRGPRWYLADNTYVDALAPEDRGLLAERQTDYDSLLRKSQKCIYMLSPAAADLDSFVRKEAIKLQFLFNVFRQHDPILLCFAAFVNGVRKPRIERFFETDSTFSAHRLSHLRYATREKVARSVLTDFHKLIHSASERHSGFPLTLSRFNSALTRDDIRDRIVDISICLESLIEGQTEVAFKCALFNALIARSDVGRRDDSFSLLHAVYAARSRIVHGEELNTKKRPFADVIGRWEEVLALASNCVSYYVLFLSQRDRSEWAVHLRRLALGLDQLITEDS